MERQLTLPEPPTWGGKRKGAGRKPNGLRSGVEHVRRPALDGRTPAHVTLKVGQGVPNLRSQVCIDVVRRAFRSGKERFGFRLVHYGVQRDHVHMLVEAEDRRALSRGLQGLTIRIAKGLNRELGRRGSVFADRYHLGLLTCPQRVRNALACVILQERRHAAARRCGMTTALDPCSSGGLFDGWVGRAPRAGPWDGTAVPAGTWLLREGWKRRGRIELDEVPGPR